MPACATHGEGMTANRPQMQSRVYRTIWRWHFYAGLFVLPFLVTLSISGTLYLFKPQIERWEERDYQGLSAAGAVAPHQQVAAALAVHEGSELLDYRLPERDGDAAMIRLASPESGNVREIFVAPDGGVLGSIRPGDRLMAIVKRIHSQLLIGTVGNRLVELAASWAILLILSGLCLWWPRGHGAAGVVWPRLTRGRRVLWRDLHAVTGFWISSLALILLLTGLPWTDVWGSAFKAVRAEMGWVKGGPAWAINDAKPENAEPHSAHDEHASSAGSRDALPPAVFDTMVLRARSERLAFPAIVTPPNAPGRFGAPGVAAWTIRSDASNVPLQQLIRFDFQGQHLLSREGFDDGHVIDRVVGYGIAWHEGQLFGPVNQAVGVFTAAGLVTMAISGFILWRRRRPEGTLGAPAAIADESIPRALIALLIVFGVLLPLVGFSLVALIALERLVLTRIPRARNWLGLFDAPRSTSKGKEPQP